MTQRFSLFTSMYKSESWFG